MTDETRWCQMCDNVHESTRKEPDYKWLCRAAPRHTRPAYTIPGATLDSPFERCRSTNTDGNCAMYTPRRTPKEKADVQF